MELQPLPRTCLPAKAIDQHRLSVEETIAAAADDPALRDCRPLVLVTGRDLTRSGCASLWGYADPRRQIAVVSTSRIRHDDAATTRARLENLIRHELGHLAGWRHCKHIGCLMAPAQNPEALDTRSNDDCDHAKPRRRRSSPLWHRVAAVAFLLLVFTGVNFAATLLKRAPKAPFALLDAAATADLASDRLLFNGQRVPHSKTVLAREDAADELNRLFRMVDPPELQVSEIGEQEAVLKVRDAELLRVRDPQAAAEAQQLAQDLNLLIAAKGNRSSLCAECHLRRKPEVLEAAYGRKWTIDRF